MKKNYIIWCPTAEKPSTRRFTEKQAATVASKLSESNHFDQFYICKIVKEAKTTTLDSHKWSKTKTVR